jgi:amino acid efflux transporter
VLTTDRLVGLPTTLFLAVYLLCMLAAARLLRGTARAAACLACGVVAVVLAFCGWPLSVAAVVAGGALIRIGRIPSRTSQIDAESVVEPGCEVSVA